MQKVERCPHTTIAHPPSYPPPVSFSTPKHRALTLDRLRIFLQERQYSDVNLRACLDKAVEEEKGIRLEVYSVPELKRIPFREAVVKKFVETRVGEVFGPS
ncbi:Glycoside hydrolase, 38 vacuolar alpha mannosidase [Dinochytrium kinnereticum]|nr:Glycoside hydrolase, 38 vacuolar alpha mannosidase [Dinochytrium kinnereticum]